MTTAEQLMDMELDDGTGIRQIYRISLDGCRNETTALAMLYCKHPALVLKTRVLRGGRTLVSSADVRTCEVLEGVREVNGYHFSFVKVERQPKVITGVVMRVPTCVPESVICSDERVTSAKRIFKWDPLQKQSVPTESVKFVWQGSTLPRRMTLGYCGTFPVRQFAPTVIRCYACQRLGHVARACNFGKSVCRRCAGSHDTSTCTVQERRCGNCGGNHPASSKLCPKQLKAFKQIVSNTKMSAKPKSPPAANKKVSAELSYSRAVDPAPRPVAPPSLPPTKKPESLTIETQTQSEYLEPVPVDDVTDHSEALNKLLQTIIPQLEDINRSYSYIDPADVPQLKTMCDAMDGIVKFLQKVHRNPAAISM